jgi:hypothetical protein
LKEAEEVYIGILHTHLNSGVTFEFDRKSEKIKSKCGTGEGNTAFSMLSLFAQRRYSKTLNEKKRALAPREVQESTWICK